MTNKEIQDCIIYQDPYYIVANKPSGISSQEDPIEGDSFHKILEKFSAKKLFVVHRLDRPTSGAIVYAKKKSAANHIGKIQQDKTNGVQKKYLAAVKTAPGKPQGELTHLLSHDKKQRKSIVVDSSKDGGKTASLIYKTIASIENYTLLEVSLNTGRFHQIRAQLGAIGSPIKGDVKYGARRGNKDRSIHLHAHKIEIPFFDEGYGVTVSAGLPNDPVWTAFQELIPEFSNNTYQKWKEELT